MPGTLLPPLFFRTTWSSLSPGLVRCAGGGFLQHVQRRAGLPPVSRTAGQGRRVRALNVIGPGSPGCDVDLPGKHSKHLLKTAEAVLSETGPDPRHSFKMRVSTVRASGFSRHRGGEIAVPKSRARQRSILILRSSSRRAGSQCLGSTRQPPIRQMCHVLGGSQSGVFARQERFRTVAPA